MRQNLDSDFAKNVQMQENVNQGQSQKCESLLSCPSVLLALRM